MMVKRWELEALQMRVSKMERHVLFIEDEMERTGNVELSHLLYKPEPVKVIRSKKRVKPKLEIRVVALRPSGVQLEAESNFFEGIKTELFAKDDTWSFDFAKAEGA